MEEGDEQRAINMDDVSFEDQVRYRAELRRSLLGLARRHAAKRRMAESTRISKKAADGNMTYTSRDVKSVAAQQRDGLARELSCVQAQNQKLSRQIEDLRAAARESQLRAQQITRHQTEHENEQRLRASERKALELSALLDETQMKLTEAVTKVNEVQAARDQIEQQLTAETAERAATGEHLATLQEEFLKLEQMLDAAHKEKSDIEREISAYNCNLDQAQHREDQLQCTLVRYEAEHKRLAETITELQTEGSALSKQLEESMALNSDLEHQLQVLQGESDVHALNEEKYKTMCTDLSSRNDELEKALQESQEVTKVTEEKLILAQKHSEEIKESLRAEETENEHLRGIAKQFELEKQNHAATNEALSASSDRVAQLESTLTEVELAHNTSSKEVSDLKQRLAKACRDNEQLRSIMGTENDKVAMQQKLVAELQGENAELRARRYQATSTYEQEHAKLVVLEREAAEFKSRCHMLEVYQKESESTMQKLNTESKQLYEERLELAQGFEREVNARKALEMKLRDYEFREQNLLAEIEQQNHKLVQQISAHSAELLAEQDKALVLEQELRRVVQNQSQQSFEVEGLNALRNELTQTNGSLKLERQKTRRLQNQIQDLKGNIRVVVRVRPSTSNSLGNVRLSSDEVMLTEVQATCKGIRHVVKTYHFDRVFGPDVSNQTVCEETEYLVQSALDGHNVCIFAYGQTGSGKTWTMGSSDGVSVSAMDSVMEAVAESRKESSSVLYTVTAESVEIYNEQFRDLLDDSPMLTGPVTGLMSGPIFRTGRSSLYGGAVREGCNVSLKMNDKTRLPELVGTTKVVVASAAHARELFAKAAQARSVAATAANQRSSRSHFVFIVHIERRHKQATNSEVQRGVLNLVDLAGSERLAHSKTTGDRLMETTAINSSLSTLGNVIKALANREPHLGPPKTAEHLTYRESKLTFLLQGSLSGDSKAMLLATLSPEADHASETRSTLQFAETASKATVRRKGP